MKISYQQILIERSKMDFFESRRFAELSTKFKIFFDVLETPVKYGNYTEYSPFSKNEEYINFYRRILNERCYDIRFSDHSLLQLIEYQKMKKYSFVYLQNPIEVSSYEEFLSENDFQISEVGNELYEVYEEHLLSHCERINSVYLRYDYDETMYSPGKHSVSHFHFGYNSGLVLQTDILIDPLHFLVIANSVHCENDIQELWKNIHKNGIIKVDQKYLSLQDELKFRITLDSHNLEQNKESKTGII